MPGPEYDGMYRSPYGQRPGQALVLEPKGRNEQWGEDRCEYDIVNDADCEQCGPERAEGADVEKAEDGEECVCRRRSQTFALPICDPGHDQKASNQCGCEIPMGQPAPRIWSFSAIGQPIVQHPSPVSVWLDQQ